MDELVEDDSEENGIGKKSDYQRELGGVCKQAHPAIYPPM